MWLHWFWALLEWQQPASEVDVAVDWPNSMRGEGKERESEEEAEEACGEGTAVAQRRTRQSAGGGAAVTSTRGKRG